MKFSNLAAKYKTMKDLKFRELYKLVIVLMVLVLFCSSCKKDDEDNSGYYGKWIAEKVVPSYDGYGAYTKLYYYLTLSSTSKFNESFY